MATTTATPLELGPRQPGRGVLLVHVLALGCAGALIVLTAPSARWNPWQLAVIGLFTIVSDVTRVEGGSKLTVSGTSLGLMLAIVLLGGGPAAMVALVTLLVSRVFKRSPGTGHLFRNDLTVFVWFLLLTGFFFHAAVHVAGVTPEAPGFYLVAFVAFVLSLV